MIESLSENQLSQVRAFTETLDADKNKSKYFYGKCGEIAVLNYGINNKIFKNYFGNDLCDSVLNNQHRHDFGLDLILQSYYKKYVRVFAQVKTIVSEYGRNLLLDMNNYTASLDYKWNNIPVDIFILVQKLSESTYDIIGFIDKNKAVNVYKEEDPISGCYCIDKKFLVPIKNINLLF